MNKYYKLLGYLINFCDCVAFEIETYENFYNNLEEKEIIELFNSVKKGFEQPKDNYEKFTQRIIKNN